jgi:hypothetical protein
MDSKRSMTQGLSSPITCDGTVDHTPSYSFLFPLFLRCANEKRRKRKREEAGDMWSSRLGIHSYNDSEAEDEEINEMEVERSSGAEKAVEIKAVKKEFLVHMLPTFLPKHRTAAIVPTRSMMDEGKYEEKWIEGISAYVPRV